MQQGQNNAAPQGAAPPGILYSGDPSLIGACRHSDLDTIQALLCDRTVNVNCRGYQEMTPLMAAAETGRSDVMKILVKKGANPTLVSDAGQNVLHLASMKGDVKCVKFILSLRLVNINAVTNEGWTATDWARYWSRESVEQTLLDHGAVPSQKSPAEKKK
ncbi:alpha-latrocrustotoxin-Lt1a-like [Haliotis rufescens]|uniref:alpha-latrocrustotoxin-Lt1a-like n=1 Tax=Haliotis rufescens TaxID=6454 RepID=UPI00201E9FDB|nr:alpha-latrocrustotoxin-Lt1a-like [Haliotis rufescens]